MIPHYARYFQFQEKWVKEHPILARDTSGITYETLFRLAIKAINQGQELLGEDYAHPSLDPERIVIIDHGDYQGTLVFIVAETGYQPWNYYATRVSYGSCSGCDTLEGIKMDMPFEEADQNPPGVISDLYTLMLHMVQQLQPLQPQD